MKHKRKHAANYEARVKVMALTVMELNIKPKITSEIAL